MKTVSPRTNKKIARTSTSLPPRVPETQLSPAARKIEASFQAILAGHVTVKEVEIPGPSSYDAQAVRDVRERLGVSVAVFAKLMGVSAKLAEAWEGGRRTPAPLACRLLDRITADPKQFRRDLLKSRKMGG